MPKKIINLKGEEYVVDENEAQQKILSGEGWALTSDEKYKMVNKRGETFLVPTTEVFFMLNNGFRLENAQDFNERKRREYYDTPLGQAVAGLAGVASGATIGGSDVAFAAAGLGNELSTLKETHPTTSMVGEIAGTVGTMILPGVAAARGAGAGAKLAAGAARALPTRALMQAGLAVEKGVAKKLGGGLVGRVAGLGVSGAAEGAVYGAGQFMSEAALGETEASAENLLASVGLGAALGGGFGGAIGGGLEGIKAMAKLSKVVGKKGLSTLSNMGDKVTGRPGLFSELMEKGNLKKATDTHIKVTAKEAQELAQYNIKPDELISHRDLSTYKMSKKLEEIDKLSDDVFQKAIGKSKDKYVLKKAEIEANENLVRNLIFDTEAGEGTFTRVTKQLDEMIVNKSDFEFISQIKKYNSWIKSKFDDLSKKATAKEIRGEAFNLMDESKQYLAKIITKAQNYAKDAKVSSTIEELVGIHGNNFLKDLERSDLWGNTLANMQAKVNKKWTVFLEEVKRKPVFNVYRKKSEGSWSIFDPQAKRVYESDPGTVKSFVDSLGDPKVVNDRNWFLSQNMKRQDLMEEIAEQFKFTQAERSAVNKHREAINKFEKELIGIEDRVKKQKALISLDEGAKRSGLVLSSLGGVGGFLLGGPAGLAAGIGIGAVLNPAQMLRMLGTLGRIIEKPNGKIENSLSRFMTKKSFPKRRLIAPAAVGVFGRTTYNKNGTEKTDRVSMYRNRLMELSNSLNNPEGTVKSLDKDFEPIMRVAPKIGQAVQMKMLQQARYLFDKMPKPSSPSMLGKDKWKPNDMDVARAERVAYVLENPLSVLNSLENGNLTHEEVQTLKDNYPKMYENVLTSIIDRLPDLQEDLPYDKKVQLSLLFDIPVDPTMQPNFIRAIQESYATGGQPLSQMALAPKTKKPKLNLERNLTATQRLAAKA